MSEGEFKKRIREERLKALHKGMTMICTHDTIEECIENDCGIEYMLKVLEEMKTDFPKKKPSSSGQIRNEGKIQNKIFFAYDLNEILEWCEKWLGEGEKK